MAATTVAIGKPTSKRIRDPKDKVGVVITSSTLPRRAKSAAFAKKQGAAPGHADVLGAMLDKQAARDFYISFAPVYQANPTDRIALLKAGIPAGMVERIAKGMATTAEAVLNMVGISRATVSRKKNDDNKPLSLKDSERLFGLAKLIGQVEVMVQESGDPTGFDAGKWLNGWLSKPNGALGGEEPSKYMDTAEGQALISNLLAQMQHGVYA